MKWAWHVDKLFVLVVAPLLSACWASGSRLGEDGPAEDGLSDITVDIGVESDSGWDSTWDTVFDDGTAPDGDHDTSADSTIADTMHDYDVPDIGDGEAVAELVGPPVAIDDETQPGGAPVVAWNGNGWGVAWSNPFNEITFRPLDAMANPIGPSTSVTDTGGYIALEWHVDRYMFVVGYGWPYSHGVAAMTLEEMGPVIDGPVIVLADAGEPDLAWSDDAGGWIVGMKSEIAGEDMLAAMLDERASPVGSNVVVSEDPSLSGPRVVSLKTRISMLWPGDDGIWFRSFQWGEFGEAAPPSLLAHAIFYPDTYIEADGYLDDTVVVGMDGHDVFAIVVEPWTGTVVSGPTTIGHSGIRDRRPGIVAAESSGFIGVCWETGPGPGGGSSDEDGVAFGLLAPNGSRLGAELTVASGLRNIGGCAVGWSGSEFVVVYWSCGGDSSFNTIFAQRVVPLI